jgi:hypothetical protein
MRRLAIAPLALIPAIAIVACGSSEKKLSRPEYIKKADAICTRTNRTAPKSPPPQTSAQAKAIAAKEAQIRRKLADELGKLNPPDQLESDVDTYKKQTDQLIANLKQQGQHANNLKAFTTDQFAFNQLAIQRAKTASKIGYAVCSQPAQGQRQPQGAAQLVAKADAICKQGNDIALAETPAQQYQPPKDFPKMVAAYDKWLPVQQRLVAQLKAMKPRPQDQQAWSQFVSAFEKRIQITSKQRSAAKARDQKAFAAASQGDAQTNQQEVLAADALGLEVCGQNGTNGV